MSIPNQPYLPFGDESADQLPESPLRIELPALGNRPRNVADLQVIENVVRDIARLYADLAINRIALEGITRHG
jgi:hypothetical protein